MRRNGLSPTKLLIVIILLGALFGVSKLVVPAPPGPPVQKPTVVPVRSAADIKAEQEHMKDMEKKEAMMRAQTLKNSSHAKPAPNSTVPDISSDYYLHHQMGTKGEAEQPTPAPAAVKK